VEAVDKALRKQHQFVSLRYKKFAEKIQRAAVELQDSRVETEIQRAYDNLRADIVLNSLNALGLFRL
jgi:hypothetical protein